MEIWKAGDEFVLENIVDAPHWNGCRARVLRTENSAIHFEVISGGPMNPGQKNWVYRPDRHCRRMLPHEQWA